MVVEAPLAAARHRCFLQRVVGAGLQSLRKREAESSKLDKEDYFAHHHPFSQEESSSDGINSVEAESFLLSGVYWTLAGLALLENDYKRGRLGFGDAPDGGNREEASTSFLGETQRSSLVRLVMKCKRTLACSRHVEGTENSADPQSESLEDAACSCCVGFAPHPDPSYPATSLSTLSALQILFLLGSAGPSTLPPHLLNKIQRFLARLQDQSTGAFNNQCNDSPNHAAEPDMRFAMCAVASLQLTQLLANRSAGNSRSGCVTKVRETGNTSKERTKSRIEGGSGYANAKKHKTHDCSSDNQRRVPRQTDNGSCANSSDNWFRGCIDRNKLFDWITQCQNLDGGFGCAPGCESHAGTTFCAIASLSLIERLPQLPASARLSVEGWLGARQLPGGGLNGRPGKSADSCYCWWILATANILGMDLASVYDTQTLKQFVLSCQAETGGISRVPIKTPSSGCGTVVAAHESPGNQNDTAREEVSVASAASLKVQEDKSRNQVESETPETSLFGKGRLESHSASQKVPDPFHTFFGLAGLSILVHAGAGHVNQPCLDEPLSRVLATVNPLYGLPTYAVDNYM
ncbi:prenyltransferase and squalene oxidase repeat-containing protein [Toxoplasma gondii MAS]|uniref:Geranylgeranyl transferase type II subunit beta n=2 Tax=Toxoplasma gondii TaxID=5811 RepID=A0A086QIU6_TOXGO|nr:prenyltransferase and squalene oxidase repeat-containing protein [Toxoplasma gondii MAS]PUA85153.1 prenyltransferase and squalene oxidase repeat-containing protein [Toxoplasma gondii TgCATBr9]